MGFLGEIRQSLEILAWIRKGMPIPPVPALKRRLISAYLDRYPVTTFIETGTFKGDTLALVAARRIEAISIELQPEFFARAQKRFAQAANVRLFQGDSGEVLPKIVADLRAPALFWLDGHYSAGATAHGALASPILGEIAAISASPIPGHIVLIDDAHEFSGRNGYPELGSFLSGIAAEGRFFAQVNANIIALEPSRW